MAVWSHSNSYFLTKKGCNNPKCNYSHSYNLSPSQLEEMRYALTICLPVTDLTIILQDRSIEVGLLISKVRPAMQ